MQIERVHQASVQFENVNGRPNLPWTPSRARLPLNPLYSHSGRQSMERNWGTVETRYKEIWYNKIPNTGWPRKNATPTITNFKEIGHLIKLVSALMSKTFLFQQNDTKIKDFDEGIIILEQFFWGNVIFKICSFCIKSRVWGREEFLWVAPPDCNAAKLRNECFSYSRLLHLQSKSIHFTRGSQTMENL